CASTRADRPSKRSSIARPRRSCQSAGRLDGAAPSVAVNCASRREASKPSGAGPGSQPRGAKAQPNASEREALVVDQAMAWYLPSRTTSMPRAASNASPTTASTSACPECGGRVNRSLDMGFRREALGHGRRGEPGLPVRVVEARELLPQRRGGRPDEVHLRRGKRPEAPARGGPGRPQPAGGPLQPGVAKEARRLCASEHRDARPGKAPGGEVLIR